jgi:hypothetical protein
VSAQVVFADAAPNGLEAMLGGLIEQNLERDPARERLLSAALVTIEAPDAGVAVTLRIDPGRVLLADGVRPGAQLAIVADSARLLALTDVPLRFGLPDPLKGDGRAVLWGVLTRRARIDGMISHPRRLARLTMLLSVR